MRSSVPHIHSGVGRVEDDLLRRYVVDRRSGRARGARRAHAPDHPPARASLSPHRLRRGSRAGRRARPDEGARALRSRLRHRLRPLRRADHDRRDAPLAARPHVGRAPAARGGRDVAGADLGHRAPQRDARPCADDLGSRRAPRPAGRAHHRRAGGAPRALGAVARRAGCTTTPRTARSADQIGMEDEGCARPSSALARRARRRCSSRSSATSCDLYFAGDMSQREIARRLGMSQMKVCRVLRRGVERRAPPIRPPPQAAAPETVVGRRRCRRRAGATASRPAAGRPR